MTKSEYIVEMEEKIRVLETRVKHLSNDLRLTREENETAMANYFELYSQMERKVEERTRDIQRLQKVLEQKGRELEMMLDSSPGMIFYKDTAQRLIRANKKFAEMAGLSTNEIIGKKYDEIFPKSKDQYFQKDIEVIEKGRPILDQVEFIETFRGERQIRIDRIPHKDINNRVIGLIGFALDITDIKQAEEQRKQLEAQLQHAQRMESIGTLAGGIAHNFNNMLMGILGHTSLMLLDTGPDHPHYKSLKTIEKQVKSGSSLTHQLLGYAREGRFEVKVFTLNKLVIQSSDTLRVAKKGIRVHHDLDENLLAIKADYGQIEQVLMNLYVNAADAMPRGGELFLKTVNVTHEDMAGKPFKPKPGKYVLLTVSDTGEGMDKKTMGRVFEPFFTTKGLAKGTGLGLASAYGIVKGHGGYIDVDSERGHGATFSIYLPATDEKAEQEKESSGHVVKGKERVLLVDDEDVVIDVAEQMLKALGYNAISARGGSEALELYRKFQNEIDIILLDMIMPGMSGGDTYDRIREINPEVKVLLSSGYSLDGEAKEILDRGCDGFIQKPFNMKDLSGKLREILEKLT